MRRYFVMTVELIGGKRDGWIIDKPKVRPVQWRQVTRSRWLENDGLKFVETKKKVQMFLRGRILAF